MTDHPSALRLASEGFALWEGGQLVQAKARYLEALRVANPAHGSTPDIQSQLASVLAALGEIDAATAAYESAIALALAQDAGETSPAVRVLRHFLATHLVAVGTPERALDVLAPGLAANANHWLLCIPQAEALHALGRRQEAREAARLAIGGAPSEEKARELGDLLALVLTERS